MICRIIAILIFSAQLSIAQSSDWSIGPSISVVRFQTREYEDKVVWGGFPDKPQWGLDIGFSVKRNIRLRRFSVSSGLIYSQRTWEGDTRIFVPNPSLTSQPAIPLQIDYFGKFGFLRIPLLGGYEYQNFTISAGPTLEALLYGRNDMVFDESQIPEGVEVEDIEYQSRFLLFGLQLGLEYTWKIHPQYNLGIGVKYNPTLTSLYENSKLGETNFRLINYGASITFYRTLVLP